MNNLLTKSDRPSKFDGLTEQEYNLEFSRYCIYSGFNSVRDNWINQYNMNMLFLFGNQWVNEEDLEGFLKDDSDQSRNRIKVVNNIILPTVSQYIGNAISMDMTVRCSAISPKAVTRRERKLEELLFVNELVENSSPEIKAEFRKTYGIGENADETVRLFSNLWQDNYVKTINMLLQYISERNGFDEKKKRLALYLALSGLCTMKYEYHNGEMKWDVVQPSRFYYDNTAIKDDLSDSEFMGEFDYMTVSSILEMYDKAIDYRKTLEESVRLSNSVDTRDGGFIIDGKIPVYKNYFIDSVKEKWGYVMDEFDYPSLEKIDYVEPGDKKPKYTEKDVIKYSQLNDSQKRIVGEKGYAEKYYDVVKYCIFIPREILLGATDASDNKDIVLESGIMRYQDNDHYSYSNVKYPYKNYTWYYENGFIFTPVSELINPQRMINRMESVKENLINSSLPRSLVYDATMLNNEEGEEGMLRNLYQGKPIKLNAKGMGVQNAISATSTTLDANSIQAYALFGDTWRMNADRIIGVNDSMKGQSQGSEQLVGVTALQIQRSSLIQEPYYDAISKMFEQVYQACANVGKRIYADNEKELSVAVGDGNMQVIKLTKEYKLEDFKAVVHRQPNGNQQKEVANQQLLQFIQLGLIDKSIMADLWNKSTPDDVAEALRRSASNDMEVAIRQQAQQEQMMNQQMQMEQQAMAGQQQEATQERIDKNANAQKDRDAKKEMKAMEVLPKMMNPTKPEQTPRITE